MKKKEIIGEGHCGLTIELNLMDQYALTHAVERMEEHNRIVAEHDAWSQKKSEEFYQLSTEEKNDWLKQNPEPQSDYSWSWPDEILPIYTFLKKLILPKCDKATVFDEEDASPIKR